jgi:hypothetical protein
MAATNGTGPLPAGYEAQPAWGFHDQTTGFSYEFSRVYGPPDLKAWRGPVEALDEDRSYWSVSRPGNGVPDVERLSWAQARRLGVRGLDFSHFANVVRMRDELPALFRRSQGAHQGAHQAAKKTAQ